MLNLGRMSHVCSFEGIKRKKRETGRLVSFFVSYDTKPFGGTHTRARSMMSLDQPHSVRQLCGKVREKVKKWLTSTNHGGIIISLSQRNHFLNVNWFRKKLKKFLTDDNSCDKL